MSAAGHSSPPPTSAAVLEFICLFTHDLRRKQKRWQDGRLRYHTFNNRIMAYDDRGNFVGDMHWRHDWDLAEGEEIQLERGGVIVQVQELSSRCEQDLSQLLAKRAKDKEQRQMQAIARSPAPNAMSRTAVRPVVTRPLHGVLGTPSGHHGRALVPKESPFEQRQQASESPDQPAAKRRKYDPPAPSKSGYASALFGQTLTLSATPMKSLPVVRRQTIQEPDSSQEIEVVTTEIVQEDPKPLWREQSKVSRHFNQPSNRQEPMKTARTPPGECDDVEDGDKPVRRKDQRSLLRKDQIDRPTNPNPVDVEVIVVDSLKTSERQKSARPIREETGTAKQSKSHKKTTEESTLSSSRHDLDIMSTEHDGINDIPNEAMKDAKNSKTVIRAEKPKHSRTKIPKTLDKPALAKPSAMKNSDHPDAGPFSPRDLNVPVTELRIKPRKKRGLVMMSDLHNTPPEPSLLYPGALDAASAATEARDAGTVDRSYRTMLSLRREDSHGIAHSRIDKSRHQRAASSELREPEQSLRFSSPNRHVLSSFEMPERNSKLLTGDDGSTQAPEDEDLFQSPTPPRAHLEGTSNRDSKAAIRRDSAKKSRVAAISICSSSSEPVEPARSDTTNQLAQIQTQNMDHMSSVQTKFGGLLQPDADNIFTTSIDDAVSLVNRLSPELPHGWTDDPYRLPSSSPEELVQLPTCITSQSSPRNAPYISQAKSSISARDLDTLQSADAEKKLNDEARMPKRQRAFFRNVVLDEDDELDAHSDAKVSAECDVVKTLNVGYTDTNTKALDKQRGSRRGTEQRSEVPELPDDDESRPDSNDVPPKEQARPKHSRSTTKTKPLMPGRELEPESEDELPVKRRRTTRKSRRQTTEPEETSLLSEQEDSEEDTNSKVSRRKKHKTSNNRPRLEKVKKSVKSRELIGFNLSALNAPLGFRGIGMPFSILSSPADESIQRKIDMHTAMGLSSESLQAATDEEKLVSASGALQAIAEVDEIAVDKETLEVDCGAPSPQTMPVALVPMKDDCNNAAEEPTGTNTPESQRQPTLIGSVEATSSTLHRQLFIESKGVRLASGESEDMTENVVGKDTTLSNNTAVVHPKIKQSRKVSSSLHHHQTTSFVPVPMIEGELKQNEVEKTIEAEHTVDHSLPACKVLASKSKTNLQVQEPRTFSVDPDPGDQDHGEYAAQNATVSSLPAFKRPTPQPALPHQASFIVNVNLEVTPKDNGNEESVGKVAADAATEYPEKRTKQILWAGARRQVPSFKPPTRAQIDIAHADHESKAESICQEADAARTESDGMSSTKLIGVLSRSNSETRRPTEAKTAADSSLTRNSALANSELALLEEAQPRASLQQTISISKRVNNIKIKPPQTPTLNSPTPAESSKKPAFNARIANPASRGRKAAVKSDAKGPVPQRMLPPTQSFAMGPISTADFASTPIEEPPKEPERPKKKMTFPGFQSAKGEGPWSREAFDLLESGRPG